MIRNSVFAWFSCFVFAALLHSGVNTQAAETTGVARPNVVLILTDNHGAWTLGCYGNEEIRTPNIDALAEGGTLFTRAFASNPVCSPTRASLLTGLVPSQHGVHSFLSGGNLQTGPNARCTLDEFTSLPEILDGAGYDCGLVGKWHLGANLSPQERLDDYWITMPHGGTSTFYDAQIIEDGKIRKEPEYLTDFWTRHAVKFIDQQTQKNDRPFFLFLSYNGPYALSRLLLRDGKNRHAAYYRDKEMLSFPRVTPHPWQLNNLDFINNPTSIRRVATEVSGVDDGVGEVMRTLEKHGISDNTIVVFVADQGWVGGHGGFFGMGDHTRPLTARDGMMRIPMIWNHKGKIASGVRSDQMIANYDFLPTLLGHLGMADRLPAKPKLPGTDFSGLLSGDGSSKNLLKKVSDLLETDGKHEEFESSERVSPLSQQNRFSNAVFYEFENLRCVRTETHKYVHRHPNGPHELYDLQSDPDEFVNLIAEPELQNRRKELKERLDAFYSEYSLPKYDMWKGGTSQVRIHDGIDEELAQLASVEPPPLMDGFEPAPIELPDGYTAELVAGPPLVTHPTMGCFDDQGRLYVCNNAGVNMTNKELEENLPNSIRRLEDRDGDGRFDVFTVFADKMTFPMGGVFHDGSLFVASPPNIWKLTDTDDDGVADRREIIVSQFGYNGNAASVHGCFLGPHGRLYWTDGYHGHEFKDTQGQVTSKREGSYLFSCLPDGSDNRIHCGGGMDNPVEVDFTDSGDMLGTVNILYTRPRVDCLVHWLHGGAYPHREKVLQEIKTTGDWLSPAHRFGHVAVSGMTRYRSGVLDHRFGNNLFTTFFNSGKVVRLALNREGASYAVTQHEFLSSPSREFHPTDVIEDADGSLLVIDTGGWFYRGCPTSQYAKPDLLGGIYRIKRTGMTPMVDPRGLRIEWKSLTAAQLIKQLNDTRFAVRQQAIAHCVERGSGMIPSLKTAVVRSDIRIRKGAVWALSRLAQSSSTAEAATNALVPTLADARPVVRQAAIHGIGYSKASVKPETVIPLLADNDAGVRREAATTLGKIGDASVVHHLVDALDRDDLTRPEEHAIIYAMIEIGDAEAVRNGMSRFFVHDQLNQRPVRGVLTALDQIDGSQVKWQEIRHSIAFSEPRIVRTAAKIAKHRPEWAEQVAVLIREAVTDRSGESRLIFAEFLAGFLDQTPVAKLAGELLSDPKIDFATKKVVLETISDGGKRDAHPSWIAPLKQTLRSTDEEQLSLAIAAVASIRSNEFLEQLGELADDNHLSPSVRMSALSAAALQSGKLDDATLNRLVELMENSASPTEVDRAAQIIGAASLSQRQLSRVVSLFDSASPANLRNLIRGFARRIDVGLATEFLDAVESSQSFTSLAEHELSDVIKRFPPEALDRGNKLLDQLKSHHQTKIKRLESLRTRLSDGDAVRGAKIFTSQKAKCSSCHRVGKTGKAVGPDLTTIGRGRSANDLLESIVFPSASIVRDYGTYQVLTGNGRVVTGLLTKETVEGIEIQQATGEIAKISRGDIEQVTPSAVSTMPAGLDESLTEQELLDVVSYLRNL